MIRLAFIALAFGQLVADAPLPVHVGGRATSDMRFGWPGTYFEGLFDGTRVSVQLETGGEHFRLLIDGEERARFTDGGNVDKTIHGLPHAPHFVRLERLTESQSGGSRFLGFTADGTILPPPIRTRQIEFIGDSYTVGYGNTSATRECSAEQVHDRTDTQQAFGPLLAKRLNADYRVIAYSGYGVVRNYAGNKPTESLPAIYSRALPGAPDPAPRDPDWHPQLIVINLGTNDFSTQLHAGEAWTSPGALHAAYRQRYTDFVRDLRAQQPQARFVLMGGPTFLADVERVAAATGAHALAFGGLELTGCNFHPSLADHRRLADLLAGEAAAAFPER